MADFIKDFWEKQGETHKDSHKASWGDHWAISLEIEAISQHIQAGNNVLEAGCANGYSLLQQYEKQPKAIYHGIDYAENMIRYAEEAKQKAQLNDEVTFSVGDITALDFPDDHFD
ncbi:MAG: class I SAM-dependent methyltransferase, partial [Rickettsiales bacterium]|nr:class I SAM-dependent methyltransferase [Rickettsiales bacterium]